ncbi:MAG TPA: PfkB family carbohydrate kinase [Stellaceae bacterium]|nr:PfkB family carbohydrate kinase [Stellaceae bacterium]
MPQPVLYSLGSINADFQVRIDRPPDTGQTLVGADFVRLGGGKAANVALLAQRLGAQARLLGHVGEDALAEQALGTLREAGIDLAGVAAVSGADTAVSMIAVLPDGRKSIVLANNANDLWQEGDARHVAGLIAEAPAGSLLVADYEVPRFVVKAAVDAAAARGLPIVIDPSPAGRVDLGVLARAAAVTPNPTEAEGLTGIAVAGPEDAVAAADWLVARHVPAVCLKLAKGGCVVAEGRRKWTIAPVSVPVVDTTGAGDAFAGGLAVALMEGRPLIEAAAFAVAASHLAVTAYGSQPAYPARRHVQDLLPRIKAKISPLAG